MAQFLRKDVPKKQTWNVQSLFATQEDWEEAFLRLENRVDSVTKYKGKLGNSANNLHAAILAYETMYEQLVQVRTYAFLRTSVDGTNESYQADLTKTANTLANVSAQIAFFETELLTIAEATMKQVIAEHADLQTYEKMLNDIIEKKPHTLATEIEQILAQLSEVLDAPYVIYERSKQTDMQFTPFLD